MADSLIDIVRHPIASFSKQYLENNVYKKKKNKLLIICLFVYFFTYNERGL